MQKCSKGHENPDGQAFCGDCGERLAEREASKAAPAPPQGPAMPGGTATGPPPSAPPGIAAQRPPSQKTNGLAIAALVLGIVGVVAGVIPLLFFIAWVLGVVAVVLGIIGRNNARQRGAGKGQATAGAILGGIAVVLGVVGVIIIANVFSSTERAIDRATSSVPTPFTAAPFTSATTSANSAKTFKVGDKVTYTDGSSIQVYTYEQPASPGRYQTADPGMDLAVIDVEFCAGTTSSRTVSYNDLGFKAQMPDNRQYASTYGGRDPDLGSGDIPPSGGCKRGFVTLQLPAGQRPSFVLWDYPGTEQARWAP